MKILYDYQAFTNIVSGASRAFCKVGDILGSENEIIWGTKRSSNEYLKQINPSIKGYLTDYNFKGKSRLINYFEKSYSANIIRKSNFDIMYATGESHYYFDIIKRPFVTTIHDMIPENYTKDSKRIIKRKILLEKANRIVTVSHNTKKELIECYPHLDTEKIDVVYHGFEKTANKYGINQWGKYLFFVGQRKSYKNFLGFIKAVAPLLKQDSQLHVLCTGNSFSIDELEVLENCKITHQVKSLGYVNDAILFDLYYYAKAFVFPSLYEGFGIPILEAFGNNCPAIISNASCFPEIAEDAAAYFNPNEQDSIIESVSNVLYDTKFASELRERGRHRVKLFTWQDAAANMNETFKRAIYK